jgi:hypothetical protein
MALGQRMPIQKKPCESLRPPQVDDPVPGQTNK